MTGGPSAGTVRVGRRSVLRAGALGGGATAAFLAACGGSDKKSDSGSGSTSNATAVTGAQPTQAAALREDGAAKPGGIVSWRDIGAPPPLDPMNNATYRAQDLAGFVYSRLLKFNTGPKPDVSYNYELVPDLAEKYEVSPDGLQITFKLRANAKFHNRAPINGRAVTAEDVKASLDRFKNAPKNTNKAALNVFESAQAPDAQTVVLKLARPYAPALNLIANPNYLWIMPKEADSGFDPAKEMIGTGPFMLDQIQPDVSVTTKKNPEYFIPGRPYVDGSTIVAIPETANNKAQFIAGRLDWTAIATNDVPDVQKANPKFQLITYLPTTYIFLAPQQRSGPFQDIRLRRALSLAMDRKALGDLVYEGKGVAYSTAVPPSMGRWWANPQTDTSAWAANIKFDTKAAKDLVKAAGFDSVPLKYIYANNAYGDVFNQWAEAYAGMLKEGGFNPTIVPQDYLREYIVAGGTFFGAYDGAFFGPQTPFTDPHDYLFNMAHSKSTRNHAGINDGKLDAMIDDEEKTFDEPARLKKVQDIQKYIMDQMYYIPSVTGNAYLFQQPWMRRLYYCSTYGFGAESHLECWIDKSS